MRLKYINQVKKEGADLAKQYKSTECSSQHFCGYGPDIQNCDRYLFYNKKEKDEVQHSMPAFTLNKGETATKQIEHNRHQDYTPYNITKALFIVKNNKAGQQVLI